MDLVHADAFFTLMNKMENTIPAIAAARGVFKPVRVKITFCSIISSKEMGSFFHLTFRFSTNKGRTLADFKRLFRIEKSKELD